LDRVAKLLGFRFTEENLINGPSLDPCLVGESAFVTVPVTCLTTAKEEEDWSEHPLAGFPSLLGPRIVPSSWPVAHRIGLQGLERAN
jgi:hypothetical protein